MSIEKLFTDEVLIWRYCKAIFTILAVQTIPILFSNFFRELLVNQLWNPFSYLQLLLQAFISLSFYKSMFWSTLVLLVLSRVHVHKYVVSGHHFIRVWDLVQHCVKFRVVVVITAVFVCTLSLSQQYAVLILPDIGDNLMLCNSSSTDTSLCLNSRSLAVLVMGIYTSVLHSLHYILWNGNLVTGSSTNTPTRQRIMAILSPKKLLSRLSQIIFGSSHGYTTGGIQTAITLLIVYSLIGGLVEDVVSPLYGVDTVSPWWLGFTSFSRLRLLTDPYLLMVMILSVTITDITMQIFFEIFAIFVMQPLSFPISPDASSPHWSLGGSLSSSDPRLLLFGTECLKELGCRGGLQGVHHREPVYAISHPGGHPRNWTSILKPSLSIIKTFTEKLRKENALEETLPSNTTLNNSLLGNTTHNNSLLGTSLNNNNSLIGQSFNQSLFNKSNINPPAAVVKKTSLYEKLKENCVCKMNEKIAALKKLPGIRFFAHELPDASNMQIFAEAQPVIWTIQGVCGLVSNSYSEDRFGVVQQNISEILTCLLQLSVALDKTGRAPKMSASASGGYVGTEATIAPHHFKLRRGVKTALKTSLYRLSVTFGSSLTEVSLGQPSALLSSKLESFMNYTEG